MRLVPVGDIDGVVRELVSVLRDTTLRQDLSQQSLDATRQYFTWERIAQKYISAIGDE
jgi:glycosyltransferase involved in cell wall biosynthesis